MDTEAQPFARERAKLASIVESELDRSPVSIEPIAAGLGTRRFYRVHFSEGEPRTLIARVEPESDSLLERDGSNPIHAKQKGERRKDGRPLLEEAPAWLPEPGLEPLRSFLENAGLPVPLSYAHFPAYHLDLLEDLGDTTLLGVSQSEQYGLYREACNIVPRLQRLSAEKQTIPAFDRVFDQALVDTKAWKWLHWAIPGLLGREASPEESVSVEVSFGRISRLLDEAPRRLAHRDFKAENLHRVEGAMSEKGSPPRLVMIDVQGAFMAPPEYDLVCLLYDLQTDLDEAFVEDSFRAVLSDLPDKPELEIARLRFDAIATIRLCKDIAHLVHAGRFRNDFRRWHEIPRGLTLLEKAVGRLTRTFSELRGLTSVIQVLTAAVQSSDSSSLGRGR